MTIDGRLIETDRMVMALWPRIRSQFAIWKLLVFAPFTRRAVLQFTNDQISPLLRSRHWKITLGMLGGLTDAQVDFLTAFADLNARKSERIFRTTALLMISLPVGFVVAVNEAYPQFWDDIGIDGASFFPVIILVYAALVGYLMAGAWRAREIAECCEFEQMRRRHARALDEEAARQDAFRAPGEPGTPEARK